MPKGACHECHDGRRESRLLTRLDQSLVHRISQPDLQGGDERKQRNQLSFPGPEARLWIDPIPTHVSPTIPTVKQDLEALSRLDLPDVDVLHPVPQSLRRIRDGRSGRVSIETDAGQNTCALSDSKMKVRRGDGRTCFQILCLFVYVESKVHVQDPPR